MAPSTVTVLRYHYDNGRRNLGVCVSPEKARHHRGRCLPIMTVQPGIHNRKLRGGCFRLRQCNVRHSSDRCQPLYEMVFRCHCAGTADRLGEALCGQPDCSLPRWRRRGTRDIRHARLQHQPKPGSGELGSCSRCREQQGERDTAHDFAYRRPVREASRDRAELER